MEQILIDFQNVVIGGVAIAPLVILIVAVAKHYGFPADKAAMLNGAVSAVLWIVATVLIPMYPVIADVAYYVIGVVVIYAVSSGIYQLGKPAEKV